MGPNLGELVTQFKNGVEYSCKKTENVNDYGTIESTIGRVSLKLLLFTTCTAWYHIFYKGYFVLNNILSNKLLRHFTWALTTQSWVQSKNKVVYNVTI